MVTDQSDFSIFIHIIIMNNNTTVHEAVMFNYRHCLIASHLYHCLFIGFWNLLVVFRKVWVTFVA